MKICVIDGNIASGKTSILEELEQLLFADKMSIKILYEPMHEWKNLELYYQMPDKYAFALQKEIIISYYEMIQNFIKEFSSNEKSNLPDVLLLERHPFISFYTFIRLLRKRNFLSKEERKKLRILYDDLKFAPISHLFYVCVSPEDCMQRIKLRNRHFEINSITLDYLKDWQSCMDKKLPFDFNITLLKNMWEDDKKTCARKILRTIKHL